MRPRIGFADHRGPSRGSHADNLPSATWTVPAAYRGGRTSAEGLEHAVDGSPESPDCSIRFRRTSRTVSPTRVVESSAR